MKNRSMIRGTPARCLANMPSFLSFKIGQYVEERFAQHFAELPLKARHFCVLRVLHHHDLLSQQELCEALWIDRATMTGVIKHLTKLKYISRSESAIDKRRVLVKLTNHGRKFYANHLKGFDQLEGDIYSALDKDELRQFKAILDRLLLSISRRCSNSESQV